MKTNGRIYVTALCMVLVAGIVGTAAAEPKRSADTLTIVDADGTRIPLTAEELQKMPKVTEAKCICVGKSSGYIGIFDYTGVRLSDLLQKAAATMTAKEYKQENAYVVFRGTDGYQVIASWTELMEAPEGRRGLVALERDGKALPEMEGQFRLVLPGDKYVGRSVKCLETIEIHTAEGCVIMSKEKEQMVKDLDKAGKEAVVE